MLEILYAGCLGLSPAILSQFTGEMCGATNDCEAFTKTSTLGIQGRSVSSTSINLKSPSLVLVMISNMSVYIYLQPFLHYTSQYWQNNVFFGGTPL